MTEALKRIDTNAESSGDKLSMGLELTIGICRCSMRIVML